MKSVAVALSGGVDSGVAALILKEKGYKVVGYTLVLGGGEDVSMAKRVAETVGIEHVILDVRREFEKEVVSRFISDYTVCKTPNPCVLCNVLKFKLGFGIARRFGVEYVSSGHYACIKEGRLYATRYFKDQAYFLAGLPADMLDRIVLPLCSMSKEDVKYIAQCRGLPRGVESQDICFVSGDYRGFLRRRGVSGVSGVIVDTGGRVLAYHDGVFNFTVGQKVRVGGLPVKLYVVSLDCKSGVVVAAPEDALYSTYFEVDGFNFLVSPNKIDGELFVKVRYSDSYHPCRVTGVDGRLEIVVEDKVRAVTPGQFAVLYEKWGDGYLVLGGGWIV